MNKTLTAIQALTICAIATLGFKTANASTDIANHLSVKNAPRTYTVRFADLNVSTIEGAKSLYTRLRYAAKVVCAPLETARLWQSDQYPRAAWRSGLMSGEDRCRTELTREFDDDIRRQPSPPSGFSDGLAALCFIETIRFSFVRGQKRIQPFDTHSRIDVDDRLKIRGRCVQGLGEISFYHE